MTYPAWYYNEFQQIGTDFTEQALVENYDRYQTSASIAAERELIDRLGITAGDSVIDFGCGTGTFAIQAASIGAFVYAVDVSQTMLAYAQHKAKVANVEKTIEFHHSGFLTYQHGAKSVDWIVTKFAFHHLPDFWKMLALLRINQMLKDGGVFYLRDTVFSFHPSVYEARINAWMERVAQPPEQGWTIQDFETHVREEFTTFGWILEGMLAQAGFAIEQANYPTSEYAEYLCRKRGDQCTMREIEQTTAITELTTNH
jgi:putative AdoMet-dependent methyltransferase